MKAYLTVLIKELRDTSRDRRTLINALLIGPLLGPIILAIIFTVISKTAEDNAEKPYKVAVVHSEAAPQFITRLKHSGMELVSVPDEATLEQLIVSKQQTVGLMIPDTFGQRLTAGESAEVRMLFDSSRDTIDSSQRRLEQAIQNYSNEISGLRLVMRGIAPEVTRPILIAERDLATPSSRAGQILKSLPYFLILSTFLGGLFLAIDATAGERERQSLEPLFTVAVARFDLVLGKLLAVMTCALISMSLSLAAICVITRFMPLDLIGLKIELNGYFALKSVVCLLPLIFLISALELAVASFAKTFRQAQSYMGFMQLIIILPSTLIMSLPFNQPDWVYAIPFVSQQLLFSKFLGNASPPVLYSLIGTGLTVLLGVIAVAITVKLFKSEKLAIST